MTTSSTNRSLDVLVGRLRKKLASVSSDYLIKNVQGKDYRLHRCGNRNKASQSTKRPATNRAAALKRGNDH